MRRLLATLTLPLAFAACGGDIDTPSVRIAAQAPTSSTAPAPSSSSTSTTRPADWAAFTRYVAGLDRLFSPPTTLAPARPAESTPQASTSAPAGSYLAAADWPLWRCTKQHEGADRWDFVGGAGGHFRGAFAILDVNWRTYADTYGRRWPDASTAPPWAQIAGARYVYRRLGDRLWGGLRLCRRITGLSPLSPQ